jgi:hypothetical protein
MNESVEIYDLATLLSKESEAKDAIPTSPSFPPVTHTSSSTVTNTSSPPVTNISSSTVTNTSSPPVTHTSPTPTYINRLVLPARKLDTKLWFHLISTSSTQLSLDACRVVFLDDNRMLTLKEDKVVNLVCAYEGPYFVLTRIQVRFPEFIYGGRLCQEVPHGRIMVFVLNSYEFISDD